MKPNRQKLKNIVRRVVSEDREPLKDILDHEVTADVVHALHPTWNGGGPEAQNLVMPIDHSAAAGSEKVTRSQEVIDHSTGKVVSYEERGLKLSEAQLRSSLRTSIRRIIRRLL